MKIGMEKELMLLHLASHFKAQNTHETHTKFSLKTEKETIEIEEFTSRILKLIHKLDPKFFFTSFFQKFSTTLSFFLSWMLGF